MSESDSHPERAGPHFVGIGQMKAGTGWLYDQLSNHPDVWMPRFKELHFFDVGVKFRLLDATLHDLMRRNQQDESGLLTHPCPPWHTEAESDRLARDFEFFRRALFTTEGQRARRRAPEVRSGEAPIRRRHVDWYRGLFPTDAVVGEITPAYGTLPASMMQSVARWLPDTKFILLVRAPADRARSHLSHLAHSGRVDEDALTDVTKAAAVLEDHPVIVEKSDAAGIYQNWSGVLGERLLVQPFARIKTDPTSVRQAVAGFLDIRTESRFFRVEPDFNRKDSARRSASPAVRSYLAERLQPQTDAFERVLLPVVGE